MKRLLIVEDDATTQKAYKEKLAKAGYQLVFASTVDEAREILIHSGTVDGILLDIMLPGGKNGFDMLELIQANDRWKTIPVIVLTNLDSEELVAHHMGVSEYLVKTNTSLEDIVLKVKKVVGEPVIVKL